MDGGGVLVDLLLLLFLLLLLPFFIFPSNCSSCTRSPNRSEKEGEECGVVLLILVKLLLLARHGPGPVHSLLLPLPLLLPPGGQEVLQQSAKARQNVKFWENVHNTPLVMSDLV